MSALCRAIQPQKCSGALLHHLDVSLRGGQRPTWRPEREARGSALGVQSREGSYDFAGVSLLFNRVLRDCTPRALPRAARSGRHVGLWPPRNDNSGSFAILTAACTRRKCGAGSGMPLPYNGVCGRRECTEICRCATRRRGRRPLQRTAGSLGRFSTFRLLRAFLSCQIQKSDRLIWVNRSGFYGNTA